MPAAPAVVSCPHCGRRNRIAPSADGIPRCGNCHNVLPWVVDATSATFGEETRASIPVLVDFWAPWCGPCRMVSPAVERLAVELAGRLKVAKLNTDEAPDVAGRYDVQGIPLLVLMRDGAEVDRRVGAHPEDELRTWLTARVGSGPAAAPPPSPASA
jgi:thioredoxin 2